MEHSHSQVEIWHSRYGELSVHSQQHVIRNQIRRKWKNRLFAQLVSLSGWLVLLTLALLIWHLLSRVVPLLGEPTLTLQKRIALPAQHEVLLLQDVFHGRFIVTQAEDCTLVFLTQPEGQQTETLHELKRLPELCSDDIKILSVNDETFLVRLSPSGIVRVERLYRQGDDIAHPAVLSLALHDDETSHGSLSWDVAIADQAIMFTLQYPEQTQVIWVDRADPTQIKNEVVSQATNVVMLPELNQVVYTRNGHLFNRDLHKGSTQSHPLEVPVDEVFVFENQRSLMLTDGQGSVQKWSLLNQNGNLVFAPLYTLSLPADMTDFYTHRDENAGFLVLEDNRIIIINHGSGEKISEFSGHPAMQTSVLLNDELYGFDDNFVYLWSVDNISSVNTFKVFWENVWYQGYQEPDFIWQTTYAKDYQEPKYSIVPLVLGSIKAACLALIIAVPLALFAAMYTAFFAPTKLRNWIKPSIEMLEAIPSVVLGFIAAIWLAPLAEQFLLSFAVFLVCVPLLIFLFSLIYQPIRRRLPWEISEGWELPVVALILVVLAAVVIHLTLSSSSSWFTSYQLLLDINKSTLVVALAMGIAITPSIYSLAEDAIFEVPSSYKQASFALGATRLQTLRKVVLTLAYPGILSAVMLGLGRALGETMIVLMVTGNTPVADWSLLSGLRALTANLAIELPEAEVNSSHYQILFLTALLLFAFTFVINTFAEILRQWLRRNYQHG